jgi:ABC-type dipeptide/oligopeptide/nickel transport system permease subunit
VSLATGLGASTLAILAGIAVGASAGFRGGRTDRLLMRVTDVFMCVPALFLVLIVVAIYGASIRNTVLVIGFAYWPPTARIVRGEVLGIRSQPYVEAARALGVPERDILVWHVLRNAVPLILVQGTLFLANAVLVESALSFLGLGVPPPLPSWGAMLTDGRRFLLQGWWIATFPGLAILVAVLGFNLLGDGLRDALDPRLMRARG